MKKYKFLSSILAASLLAGAISMSSVMADDTDILYSYINEYGETVAVTQAMLDAGHWNNEMLNGAALDMYQDFPMSIDKFVNDLGDISLDLSYMKNLNDFSSVVLSVTDLNTEETVFSKTLEGNCFYSPVLDVDKTYIVTLEETIDGETAQYRRIVQVSRSEADMPAYMKDGSSENNVLIAPVDAIRSIYHVQENGEIVIDNRQTPYTGVPADEFADYCKTLAANTEYRVYTQSDGVQYSGFVNGSNADFIYDYTIFVSNYEALYTPAPASRPSSISLADVKKNAVEMGFEDYSFRLSDGSTSTSKYEAYMINLNDYPLENIGSEEVTLRTTIRSNVSVGVYLWLEVNGVSYSLSTTPETGTDTRTFTVNLKKHKAGITPSSKVQLYAAVYFPTSTVGYGMIYSELLTGYDDDVTGSIHEAIDDVSTPTERPDFAEFYLNGGMDADIFYLKGLTDYYKVSIRNRSFADQALLDSGKICKGGGEKQLVYYSAHYPDSTSTNVLDISEYATYRVPKNADLMVLVDGSIVNHKTFVAVKGIDVDNMDRSNYQISYVMLEDDSVIEG